MTDIKQCNGLIKSTHLFREDHGIMTCFVNIEFDGGGCGFGGFVMDRYDEDKKRRVGSAYGMDVIMGIIDTVGVDSWEKLPGKYVRVNHKGLGGRITSIGHITEDKWLDLEALSKEADDD